MHSLNQRDQNSHFIFFIFNYKFKQMKSPLFHQQYTSGLNLSAVYEPRKSKTPSAYLKVNNGESETQKQIQHNRSFVFEKELQKKQYGDLRSTIGSPTFLYDVKQKKQLDNFLRNTSQFTLKFSNFEQKSTIKNDTRSFKPTSSQVNTPISIKKQYLDSKEHHRNVWHKEDNYSKIMQKYDKKQKLIKQLKKISQIKISEKIRETYEYEKLGMNGLDKGNQPYTDRILINISSPKPPSDVSVSKIDLNRSTVNDLKKNETNSNYLKEKILNTIVSTTYNQQKLCSKNPEEQSKNHTYYTPKVKKGYTALRIDSRYTPTINTSKEIINKNYLNVSDVRALNDTSLSKEIYSPAILSKNRQPTMKAKTMNDIKDTLASSKHRNSTCLLTSKKLTINDFELGKSLGEGKFGIVYRAVHKQSKFLVALKKITKQSIKSNYMIDQFLLEVKIQSFCEHQNILRLYGCFDDKEHIYLILDYMEEGTLFKLLKQKKTFSQHEASVRLRQVAQAIRYLHERGIAHRDIKPENIVISHGVGKLCDFGWAAICNERRKTYCGTFDYAAPQILEGEQYDMSVDLWCLGVLAYELMVGRAPFYHISRKQTMKKILNVESTSIDFPPTMSRYAVSFIQNLVRKKPEERMTAEDVLRHPFLLQME